MASKGQFMGLDWNRITRLHSQVMTESGSIYGSRLEPHHAATQPSNDRVSSSSVVRASD